MVLKLESEIIFELSLLLIWKLNYQTYCAVYKFPIIASNRYCPYPI